MDTGILTFLPPGWRSDVTRRNDLFALEERLRFTLSGWQLAPALGGEPFHPDEHFVDSISAARLQLHHLLERDVRVIVLFFPQTGGGRAATALVRYLDAIVSPPLPVVLLGFDGLDGGSGEAACVSAELRLVHRRHSVHVATVQESDRAFGAFGDDVEVLRDEARKFEVRMAFRDDLRRHHHLRIAPSDQVPLHWQIPRADAHEKVGISVTSVDAAEFHRRVREILRADGRPIDPRLLRAIAIDCHPTEPAHRAAVLVARDLADECHAQSVALGPQLGSRLSGARIATGISQLTGPDGTAWPSIAAVADGDDAGALTQAILQRALPEPTLRAPSRFNDPGQLRPARAAATLTIRHFADGEMILDGAPWQVPDGATSNSLTCARVVFAPEGPRLFHLQAAPLSPGPIDGTWRLCVKHSRAALLRAWPSDRITLIAGDCAARVAELARSCGLSAHSP